LHWYCDGCRHGIAKIPDRDRTQRSVASYLAANGTLNQGFVRHADFLTRRGPPTQSRSEDPAGGSALSVAATSCAVRAQTSLTAFFPEMNSHSRLSSDGMYGLRCQWLHGIRRPESRANFDQAFSSLS